MLDQYGICVEACDDMPENELALVDRGEVVHRITNVGKPKAIEPDAIQTPGRKVDWTKRVVTNVGDFERLQAPTWNPSPLMRALGFTRNPMTCAHNRKRLMLGSDTWRCAECGEELGHA
jgi:hypothetical protein